MQEISVERELPKGVQVFERGWLSSNNILFLGANASALVDSGYSTHAAQTTALVDAALQQRPLDLLLIRTCTATTAAAMRPCSTATPRFKPSFRPARRRWSRCGTRWP